MYFIINIKYFNINILILIKKFSFISFDIESLHKNNKNTK